MFLKQNLEFFNAYSLVYRPLTNHTNRIFEKHDLSGSYWRVLRILEGSESKKFGEITDALKIEKPALTNIIKKLAAIGFVEIQQGRDKREKIVMLTTLGNEKISAIRQELNPFLENAVKGLTQEQLNNAIEVLQIIQKNITKS